MVRNSKRKAFTIVELVIVIAVIAILAAVMIPTFGGVIDSANLSADKQLLSTVNTQLRIYTDLGNKIETEADLWKALKGDFNGGSDLTAKFDPKSANRGYHYWYSAAKQQVEVLTYEEVNPTAQTRKLGKMFVLAAETRDAVVFAPASPRSFVPGYYFLDTKCENNNDIADFFDLVADMSIKTKEDYQNAIRDLNAIGGDNEALASAVNTRMAETAIVTDKGAFINTTENKIKHIYIPENKTDNKDGYYLNHNVIHANDAYVNDLASIATQVAGSTVELPSDIKAAEGSLVGFGNITVKVDVDNATKLGEIFSAESISVDAIIKINNGAEYKIEGTVVKENKENGAEVNVTLAYANPATSIVLSADGNIVFRTNNNYIALDKIKNKTDKIALTITADPKSADGKSAYSTVKWSTTTPGVKINETTGVVSFEDTFNANVITFKAIAVTTKLAEDGTVQKDYIDEEFEVDVIRVTSAMIEYNGGAYTGKDEITDGTVIDKANNYRVDYNDEQTSAGFEAIVEFEYGNNIAFSTEETTTLGLTSPVIVMTSGGTYFTMNDDYGFTFTGVKTLLGGMAEEVVEITVSDNAGKAFSATVKVTVNDNTNVPYKKAIPDYKNGYRYKVGNVNEIALGEFFATRVGEAVDLSEYRVYVYDSGPSEGFFYTPIDSMTINSPQLTDKLDFSGRTGQHWIVLATNTGTADDEKTAIYITVDVVDGTNITSVDQFVVAETDETNKANSSYKNVVYTEVKDDAGNVLYINNAVLHNNIETDITDSKHALLTLDKGAKLYGNYFTITAKKFKDEDYSTSSVNGANGYGMISMISNSEINNLIVDGPVYPEISIAGNENKYYCFGVVSTGTGNVINDSYIFGFCSPVRIQGGNQTTINNTVLEGGTWSNLFIGAGQNVTLNNVKTMQNHITGYTPTLGDHAGDSNYAVMGMGIYVHDDYGAAALTDLKDNVNNETELTINLTGTNEQYNWLTEDTSDFGGNVSLAQMIVFAKEGGKYKYAELMHFDEDGKAYVNGALAYQSLELSVLKVMGFIDLGKNRTPTPHPDIVVNDQRNNMPYSEKTGLTLELNGNDVKKGMGDVLMSILKQKLGSTFSTIANYGLGLCTIGVDVWASSPAHSDGNCEACLDNFEQLPNLYEEFCEARGDDSLQTRNLESTN